MSVLTFILGVLLGLVPTALIILAQRKSSSPKPKPKHKIGFNAVPVLYCEACKNKIK